MDILIACHDKFVHKPIFITSDITYPKKKYNIYLEKEMKAVKSRFGINRIDYIDIRAKKLDENQYNDWSKLPCKYDIIFFVHCPVYGLFHDDANKKIESGKNHLGRKYKNIITQNFYSNARYALKPRGYLQIPFNFDFNPNDELQDDEGAFGKYWNSTENVKKMFKKLLVKDFKLSIITEENKKETPFYANIDYENRIKPKELRYVLVKFINSKTKKNIKKSINIDSSKKRKI